MIRVLPRDAFNDANLLKCIGKLTMDIEDGKLPKWSFDYDGEPFKIVQDASNGTTYVDNIAFNYCGSGVHVSRPMNSREQWPLYVSIIDDEFEVFDDQGNLIFN